MSIFFTTLYVALSHLSPEYLFPGIGPYHPLVWLFIVGALAALLSVCQHSYPFRAPQNILLIGFSAIIVFSSAVEAGPGRAASALWTFLPSLLSFYLCSATIYRTRHLRLLSLGLTIVAFFQAISGMIAYYSGATQSPFLWVWPPLEEQIPGQPLVRRICGLGFLNDPNDFAQFLLVMLPLIWTLWRNRAKVRNFLFVIVPTLLLLWAIVLTQSRGGLLAFGVMLLFAFRKRFGNTISIVLTLVLLAGILTSGLWKREDLSVHENSAAGRVEAWGNGIAMWKSSPLWGVGFGQFGEHNEDQNGLTAHNSYVLCFAELGTLGYLLWLGLITATLLDLNSIQRVLTSDDFAEADIQRWATAVRLALIGYLSAAWFLSRTYYMTLYVLLGMAVAVVRMANGETEQEIRAPGRKILAWSAGAAFASIVLVYCTLWSRAL